MIYKLTLDFSSINLNVLIEEFTKNNIEVCFGEDCLYVYSSYLQHQRQISNIMKEKKIQNYFFKELISPPTRTPTNYVQTWLLEKFNEQERLRFEEQHQAELKKAQENIQKAMEEYKQLYTKYVNQQNKEAQSDGGSNN